MVWYKLIICQILDGSSVSLKRKDRIKYLEVMIDDTISWKYHIAYVFFKNIEEYRWSVDLSYERHYLLHSNWNKSNTTLVIHIFRMQ